MKKLILKISVIFLALLAYFAIEMWYLNHFTNEIDEVMKQSVQSTSVSQLEENCMWLEDYLHKNKWLMAQVASKDELEKITLALDNMKSYLREDMSEEARVSASEIRRHLSHINEALIIENKR